MFASRNILLVDDNHELRETLVLTLRLVGHVVTEAAHGGHALKALASPTVFDLIILDLSMPVMDGAAFLAFKGRGLHALLPVIIFSSSPPAGLEALAGVVAVVPKLEGMDVLIAAIGKAPAASAPPTGVSFV